MKSRFPLFFVLIILIFGNPSAKAATFPVSDSTELQDALTAAAGTMEADIIELAPGLYNTPGTFFDGTGMGDFDLTLIGSGIGATILDGQDNNAVMILESDGGNLSVSGITFQNGNFSGGSGTGGLRATSTDGLITVEDCEFDDNETDDNGGGAHFNTRDPGGIVVLDSIFTNNTGETGGGIWFNLQFDGTARFEGNTFTNNEATGGNGGGIRGNGSNGDVEFINNTFEMNTAASDGGGIRMNTSDGSVTATGNTFTNSTATTGDGGSFRLNTSGGDLTFNNNTSSLASADSQGGGLNFSTSSGMLTAMNNTFTNGNDSAGDGGGIWFRGGSTSDADLINNIIADSMAQLSGGGIFLEAGGTVNIINNTVTGNEAGTDGGGMRLIPDGGSALFNTFNNIVYDNTSPDMTGMDINVTVNSVDTFLLFNNLFSEFCLDGDCDPMNLGMDQGSNLINQDPLFLDPLAFNFHLGAGSPAIDAGDGMAPALPATDHDGNPRVFGPAPDMGALEALPMILADPSQINFGAVNVGDNSSADVTLSNAGSVDLDITGLTLVDSNVYSLDVNGGADPCGSTSFTLLSGESCTVTITFTPNADGTFDAVLNIDTNDPSNPTLVIDLTGTGNAPGGNGGCSCRLDGTSNGTQGLWVAWLALMLAGGLGWWRFRGKLRFSSNGEGL